MFAQVYACVLEYAHGNMYGLNTAYCQCHIWECSSLSRPALCGKTIELEFVFVTYPGHHSIQPFKSYNLSPEKGKVIRIPDYGVLHCHI